MGPGKKEIPGECGEIEWQIGFREILVPGDRNTVVVDGNFQKRIVTNI